MKEEEGRVLVLGATSRLAKGVCGELAARRYHLILAGRDTEELKRISADLEVRKASSSTVLFFDAEDDPGRETFVNNVIRNTPAGLLGIVACVGWMGHPEEGKWVVDAADRVIKVNYSGVVPVIGALSNHLRNESSFIVGVSSVAGDRGRKTNYPYGAAKGGLSIWLQGLRNDLYDRNIRVLTIKPGFLDTRMTFGAVPPILAADPIRAGRRIVQALDRRADIVYIPWFWKWIMLLIKAIPEPIFKRMSL